MPRTRRTSAKGAALGLALAGGVACSSADPEPEYGVALDTHQQHDDTGDTSDEGGESGESGGEAGEEGGGAEGSSGESDYGIATLPEEDGPPNTEVEK